MGSLMAGWDSHTPDPKSESLERNRSLTKEEIDAFWRSKKETEDEHLTAISNLSRTIQPGKYEDTVPLARRMKKSFGMDVDKNMEQLKNMKKNGWWTKSNWAFLNEPPVMEAPTSK
ncbi:uncharacterized protein [Medicago truncatula]|nr:uncharacterized protein LOC25490198 isoform X2 [Medicago truncatula]KEH36166.1 hypothetical protein MTR_3g111970 [Medicago truncatula]